MPNLEKNTTFKFLKGSRAAVDKVDRTEDVSEDILDGFIAALANFREEYHREPDWDQVRFIGGFSTLDVIFEIIEDNEDE